MSDTLASAGLAPGTVLPLGVQEALGELVSAAKEGLLALSVGVGLGVLAELMEEEVVGVVGAKGKHDPDRAALRHGHEAGEVTLGGRRLGVERPRVRSADNQAEVRLVTYEHFADRDQLSRVVLERMLAGVSTRRYRRTQEPVGAEVERAARSTSRSAVSRTFVERTRRSLGELMSRRLDDIRLAVMMIDGLELQGRTNVVALGITTESGASVFDRLPISRPWKKCARCRASVKPKISDAWKRGSAGLSCATFGVFQSFWYQGRKVWVRSSLSTPVRTRAGTSSLSRHHVDHAKRDAIWYSHARACNSTVTRARATNASAATSPM